jgi:protein TonB
MESSTILTADVLDIIFEGRNKDYGAYDLRRSYRKRLLTSISVMLSVMFLAFIGFAFTNKKEKAKHVVEVKDLEISAIKPEEKQQELPPPPPKPVTPPPQVQTIRNTTIRIVQDDQVREDEKPPVNQDLADVKIGSQNLDGVKGDDVVAPPNEVAGTGVVDIPKKEENEYDGVFTKVEIESDYPGGLAAWARYLNRNLRYPQEALDAEIQGSVLVQFIVDKEGNVSDVEAISGPQELRAEAVRVIKKSGKWTPAVQNGRQVKSYKKQPVVFRINAE